MRKKLWIILSIVAVILAVSISAGAAGVGTVVVFDDMEHGDPSNNGWFSFGGSVGGGGISSNSADLPPFDGGVYSLETGWGSGGNAGFYGGFGRTFLTDLSGADTFTFWINPNAGQDYTLEINLQEDDTGDDGIGTGDDEYQFNCVISAAGPCAVSGGGWQKVAIPFSDFFLDTSQISGGNGVLDAVPVSGGGNGQLVNIIYVVIGSGSDVNFRTDYWAFTKQIVDDFETELFSGTDGALDIGFYTFRDLNSTVAFTRTMTSTVPGSAAGNHVLQVDTGVVTGGYAGIIHAFENDAQNAWEPQNWSPYLGVGFWLYGNNTGSVLFIDILDNRNPGSSIDDAERWSIELTDDFSGWKYFEIPFGDFARKEVGNGAPNDGFTLTEVHGWAFGVFNAGTPFTNYIDDVRLYGTAELPELAVIFDASSYDVNEGGDATITVKLSRELGLSASDPAQVSVDFASEMGTATPDRDYTDVSGTLTFTSGGATTQTFVIPTFDNTKHDGNKTVILRLSNPVDVNLGVAAQAYMTIEDDEPYDPALIDDFERGAYLWENSPLVVLTTPELSPGDPKALPGQTGFEHVLQVDLAAPITGSSFNGHPALERSFAIGQDWSISKEIEFWFYGNNTGEPITVTLKDNRVADPGPAGWNLVWSDEFNAAAGTAPNPEYWSYEIGDGSVNGIPGWGNAEMQYYTSSTDNSATDGAGNLVITAREATGEQCYYGACEYTSARLISQYKTEFAYGRIESRILVPDGPGGLWPAFWSLGTDIGEVSWPQTGEIDFMEYVSRIPNEIFGTIHGPGYSGGNSFGDTYDFGEPVSTEYHTYAIEWEPDVIRWYVDGNLFHTATPADVSPNQWVFNDPVFLILNMAIGGNFGGNLDPTLTFPQEMKIDYVRVYQGPDTAERFETSFPDDFTGWKKIKVPFASFVRSAEQPAGAPDDGLTLTEVWAYGFETTMQGLSSGAMMVDQVYVPLPELIVVTNLNDSGSGSLRQALRNIRAGGNITFLPELNGGTIHLTSGALVPTKNLTINALPAPDSSEGVENGNTPPVITVDGGGTDRILIVYPGLTVNVSNMVLQNGYGWQLAGGVLNNGNLTLDHVTVRNNSMETNAGDFWQGGAGIYNGEKAVLNLLDSMVTNNHSGWAGGGIHTMFNSETNITRSTISGNTAVDVGGGLRLIGNAEIVNSTISGNTAVGWHGGAFFLTDGVVNMTNSTVAFNSTNDPSLAAVFVGTFGPGSATLNLDNTIIADNHVAGCFLAPWGAGAVAINADGNNLFSDTTCFNGASDLVVATANLGILAPNGGLTLTHALLNGSPALDAADGASCPATDQRGISRPQVAGCDIGAYERAVEERPYFTWLTIIQK